ncbi:hypothetical protein EZV73_19150 [Acidaminobacter sp. JC074]|uniref:tyrosine-protein phosphatase n=1 Tax=Acidaminobacter sp. JC074 TaxID=2530199 RepID=UPI001F115DA9|nr:CpsB/CapC family capsule biosynthesis tyrosine phosphatase [Acidaminobacter sp. JC074]MCH4889708.1 hypothetical protein [Acidaminobacter sp. JC074]
MTDKLFDIHSHIIYDVDDGSKSLEDSLVMLKQLYEIGVRKMVFTPHFLQPKYVTDTSELFDKYEIIKSKIEEEGIGITPYLANEIMINPNILDQIHANNCLTINKTKYVLVECPLFGEIQALKEFVFNMKLEGYFVILAHPARYEFIQRDFENLEDLIDLGVYTQLSLASLLGYYGRDARRVARRMIRKKMVHFIGTDLHRKNSSVLYIKKSLAYIRRYYDKEMYQDVTFRNAEKMINDELID